MVCVLRRLGVLVDVNVGTGVLVCVWVGLMVDLGARVGVDIVVLPHPARKTPAKVK